MHGTARPLPAEIGDNSTLIENAGDLALQLAGICIDADDLEPATRRVLPDRIGLILGGILLVVGRHAHVFSRAPWTFDLNSIRAGLMLYHAHHPSAAV